MKLYEQAMQFILKHGSGWVFSSSDLLEKFSRSQADNLLSELVKDKKIRKISRGMYEYPKYSDFLKEYLGPDIDQVAGAYARKFNWRIEILGESALNILGLSTQVVARYVYLTDGANRVYDIFGITLEFKKSTLKDIGFKHNESSLIVQALKALGKDNMTNEIVKKIQNRIDSKMYKKILKDTKNSTGWIYEAIKIICKEEV